MDGRQERGQFARAQAAGGIEMITGRGASAAALLRARDVGAMEWLCTTEAWNTELLQLSCRTEELTHTQANRQGDQMMRKQLRELVEQLHYCVLGIRPTSAPRARRPTSAGQEPPLRAAHIDLPAPLFNNSVPISSKPSRLRGASARFPVISVSRSPNCSVQSRIRGAHQRTFQ